MLLDTRNVLLVISSAIQTFLKRNVADNDLDSVLEPIREQITAAPSSTTAFLAEKRDLNLCTEWEILGNNAYINCNAPYTCVFGDFGSGYYWECGVMSSQVYWKTACNNYPITSNNLNNVYCPSSQPYCATTYIYNGALTYSEYQCATTTGVKVTAVTRLATTSTTPPSTTSTPAAATSPPPAAPNTPTSTTSTSYSNAASTPNPTVGTTSVVVTVTQPTTSTAPQSASTTPSPATADTNTSSSPKGVNLAAVIAGTLGGVGSFAAGLIAIYEFLKRRRKRMEAGTGGAVSNVA